MYYNVIMEYNFIYFIISKFTDRPRQRTWQKNLYGLQLALCSNAERRQNTNFSGKDLLFMSFYVLKRGQQWKFTAKILSFLAPRMNIRRNFL